MIAGIDLPKECPHGINKHYVCRACDGIKELKTELQARREAMSELAEIPVKDEPEVFCEADKVLNLEWIVRITAIFDKFNKRMNL